MSDAPAVASRYDVVALVSNDLATDQRMHRSLTSLSRAGYRCLLLGALRSWSTPLPADWAFAAERLDLRADAGKRFYWRLHRAHHARLLALRPRLILAVDLDTIWAARRAGRRLGIPFVFDAHELFDELPEVARRWHIRLAWRVLGRWCVPAAAAAYTVGHAIAHILSTRYGLPFAVVRNCPEALDPTEVHRPRELAGSDPERPFTILYQGALNEGRGIEELIGAAARLRDVRVLIAGNGPEGPRLRALAKSHPAAEVTFLGALPPAELRALTPTADLGYALMRDVGLNYRLSLSNKSLDYIQAGLPSLQMDWPEYRRLHDEYGCYHLVRELTIKAVVDAVRACRQNEYHARLRAACIEAAPRLTWSTEAEVLLALIAGVLPSAPAHTRANGGRA